MRNIVAHIPPKSKERFAARLKQIWLQESKKEAMMIVQAIIYEFGQRYPEAIGRLFAVLALLTIGTYLMEYVKDWEMKRSYRR